MPTVWFQGGIEKVIQNTAYLLDTVAVRTSLVAGLAVNANRQWKRLNEFLASNSLVNDNAGNQDVLVDGLNAIDGITCPLPEGAFYAFPNISGTGLTSQEFETRLLAEAGVSALAGTSFGAFGEGYARFSFANSQENLREALRRMESWVATL